MYTIKNVYKWDDISLSHVFVESTFNGVDDCLDFMAYGLFNGIWVILWHMGYLMGYLMLNPVHIY